MPDNPGEVVPLALLLGGEKGATQIQMWWDQHALQVWALTNVPGSAFEQQGAAFVEWMRTSIGWDIRVEDWRVASSTPSASTIETPSVAQ